MVKRTPSPTPYVPPADRPYVSPTGEQRESPDFPYCDGRTHINIYNLGQTNLGKRLSHFVYSPFVHPHFGPFNSMEGFWHYIRVREPATHDLEAHRLRDQLRTLHGYEAKKFGKSLPTGTRRNFRELVIEANYHKVMQTKDPHSESKNLRSEMVASTLRFEHYYILPSKVVVHPTNLEWLVAGFERIRRDLKLGIEPAPVDPYA